MSIQRFPPAADPCSILEAVRSDGVAIIERAVGPDVISEIIDQSAWDHFPCQIGPALGQAASERGFAVRSGSGPQ